MTTEAVKIVTMAENSGNNHGHRQRFYHMRKDASAINLYFEGEEMTLTSRKTDTGLVHAAMYEALAAMEQAIAGLKAPLDTTQIRTGVQDTGPLGPQNLKLKNYLTPALIKPKLKGQTKDEIISELVDLLALNKLVRNRDDALNAVLRREASMSTGLQYGVAIPHGKTDTVDGLVCAVGVKKEGVDFDALDGKPSKIFILTISPETKPAPHIQFMSTISGILDEAGRQRILATVSPRRICIVFTEDQ